MNKLDISSLEKAYDAYSKALNYGLDIEQNSSDKSYEKEIVSNALIHHFKIVYELSWKMMKKYIEMEDSDVKILTKKDLFRIAGEKGLIQNFHKWVEFHSARNKTSHTYDEDTAKEVYETSKEFKNYIKDLISALEERIEYDQKLENSMENHK